MLKLWWGRIGVWTLGTLLTRSEITTPNLGDAGLGGLELEVSNCESEWREAGRESRYGERRDSSKDLVLI